MYKPLLDYKEDNSGIRYDYAILFLQEKHVKTILGVLLKEKIKLENILEYASLHNEHSYKKSYNTICELINVISCYEEKST